MTRKEMLKQLSELPHPITVGLVVFDDGCQFCILTNHEGFAWSSRFSSGDSWNGPSGSMSKKRAVP